MAGDVIVNEHRVDKAGTKVPIEAEIRLKGDDLPYVGRGLKLAGALERWPICSKAASPWMWALRPGALPMSCCKMVLLEFMPWM